MCVSTAFSMLVEEWTVALSLSLSDVSSLYSTVSCGLRMKIPFYDFVGKEYERLPWRSSVVCDSMSLIRWAPRVSLFCLDILCYYRALQPLARKLCPSVSILHQPAEKLRRHLSRLGR